MASAAPLRVEAPASADEVAALLRQASAEGWQVEPRGRGTKAGWGNPAGPVDLALSTLSLARLVEHAAGDLVVTAQAGQRLDELQDALAREGQMLALDPPEADGTIGGTLAANASGPRRLRYGTARDLVIGTTVVLADGTIARSGGKVVKNVAGYDLAKLLCGSLGTLGVIVEATFRLHPLPAAARTVTVAVESPVNAGNAVQSVLHSSLVPSALELELPDGRSGTLAVLFEGVEPGVEAQASTAAALLATHGDASALDDAAAAELWRRLRTRPWGDADAGLKVRCAIADLPPLLDRTRTAAEGAALTLRVTAHAGSGIAHVGLAGGDAAGQIRAVEAIRAAAEARGGSALLVHGSPELRRAVDAFGSLGDAGPLMLRVKQQFDPAGLLNAGRFAGGL
jgi:glycolate oxidase FAD binding subunit